MNLYREHKLHSGPGGPVVKKKKQAIAIQLSMARKEGHHIPVKGSFQQGGTAQETGKYLVHEGEKVLPKPEPDRSSLIDPNTGEWPGTYSRERQSDLPPGDNVRDVKHLGSPAHYTLIGDVWHPELKHRTAPPVKGSFAEGGLVPETGNYQVHQGEQVKKPVYGRNPVRLEDTGLAAASKRQPFESDPKFNPPPRGNVSPLTANLKRVPPTGWGRSSGQSSSGPTEDAQRSAQEKDIAARTNQAQHDEWNRAMHQKEDFGGAMGHGRPSDMLGQPPQPRDIPPAGNDPHYAVAGLKGNVAQRMHEQGERAAGLVKGSFQEGGTVPSTGNYEAHAGEQLIPPERASAPAATTSIQDSPKGGMAGLLGKVAAAYGVPSGGSVGSRIAAAYTGAGKSGISGGGTGGDTTSDKGSLLSGGGKMTQYNEARSAVGAPLSRSSSNFDSPPASYKRGGTIPRTGIYRLHQGETVIPKSLAERYREMKKHA